MYSKPFTAAYQTIGIVIADIVTNAAGSPNIDEVLLRVTKGTVRDAVFHCENPSGGELFLIQADDLGEFVPDWMSLVDPGELYQQSEYFSFVVHQGRIELRALLENIDEDEYPEIGPSFSLYRFDGTSEPSSYVIDVDGEEIQPDLSLQSGNADFSSCDVFCDEVTSTAC